MAASGIVLSDAQLRRGYGVVLVDDGQDLHLQQPVQRIFKVPAPLLVLHVLGGKQDLRHIMVIFGEMLVIYVHELALPHRGGGLLPRDVRRPGHHAQLSHPMAMAPEETSMISWPAFFRSAMTRQSSSIRRIFSRPVS
jgi:hypothetical protein